jgi:hypothetical protein
LHESKVQESLGILHAKPLHENLKGEENKAKDTRWKQGG